MTTMQRRNRLAADIALGYAADAQGRGIAFISIATGETPARVVRLTFAATPMPGVDGREIGYAALTAAAELCKARGFGRVRIRLLDERIVQELGAGDASPPKALSMAFVRARCLLHALGSVRLETSEAADLRDLATRARAEVTLHAAA